MDPDKALPLGGGEEESNTVDYLAFFYLKEWESVCASPWVTHTIASQTFAYSASQK